jgi:hypothetical protein
MEINICPTCGQPITATDGEQRRVKFRLNITASEKADLKRRADAEGQTPSQYVRDRIF